MTDMQHLNAVNRMQTNLLSQIRPSLHFQKSFMDKIKDQKNSKEVKNNSSQPVQISKIGNRCHSSPINKHVDSKNNEEDVQKKMPKSNEGVDQNKNKELQDYLAKHGIDINKGQESIPVSLNSEANPGTLLP